MAISDDKAHPSLGSAGHAALGAAGEAAAFLAGAPIAGAADAAVELGEVVAEREARLEDAITGRHAPEVPARKSPPWLLLLFGVLVLAALIWALKA